MQNFIGGGNHTSIVCTTGLYASRQKILFSALNSSLAITAFLGNVLIIAALQKVSCLHPPSKLLLGCLASTDLCVGLIAQPLHVAFLTSPEHSITCYYFYAASNCTCVFFGGVSLLTITAISVDRLLALLLGLRYRQVVTIRRARIIVAMFWFSSMISPLVYIYSVHGSISVACTSTFFCTVISTFCYTKIYLTLRHHRAQVQEHVNQDQQNGGGIALNIARYRRTVSSALWVLLTLVVCYLPYAVMAIFAIMRVRAQFLDLAWELALSLIMLNSSLNPLLYCWKMREVRQAVKNTISQIWCFSK
ncbi:trace amine-associated receptor 9-like [Oculina patagonica]